MKWLNNRNAIITISIALFLIVWTILGVIKNQKIKKHGLFAIATISETSQGKSGTNVKAIFYYKNKPYKISFLPSSFDCSIGRQFFIKFLPDNPMKYDYYDINAPDCVKNDIDKAWKEIPVCN